MIPDNLSYSFQRWPVVGLVGGLALLFTVFVSSHFRNMPAGDDFIAILKPALVAEERGWQAVGPEELFAQHFSHRIVPVRALAMGQVLFFRKLNFEVFMWVGLLAWLGIFGLLVWQAKFFQSAIAMGFISLVWFQPQAAANCLVAMQAASNLPVILIAFAAFFFRTRNSLPRWVAAWVMGLLATMTTGNGLLVPVILLIWDMCDGRWKRFAAGFFITAIVYVLYFVGFTNPDAQKYLSTPKDILGNILVMTGAILNLGRAPLWAVEAFGAFLGAWAFAVLLLAIKQKEKFLIATLLFAGGSIILASFARAGWGNEYMLQDRYLVYPIILLSICGSRLAVGLDSTLGKYGIVFCGILLAFLNWWHNAPKVVSSARSADAEAMGWQLGFPSFRFCADKKANVDSIREAIGLLQKADEKGIFSPEDAVSDKYKILGFEKSYSGFGEWNGAVSGYLVRPPPTTNHSDYILFEADGWRQVGFRPVHRISLARLLLRQQQKSWSYVVAAPPALMPDLWKGDVRMFK